jgi:uncharacterized coiled-coil DUF342 family protein
MADRDVYVEKFKAKVDKYNARIEKLQAEFDRASAEARQDYADEIAKAQKMRDDARERMREFADGAWRSGEEMRKGFESAWSELSDAAGRAFSRG